MKYGPMLYHHAAPEKCAPKGERIDLGLAILSAVALPNVRYTQNEIAAWAGCSRGMIYLIERNALKKLRNNLFFRNNPLLREMMAEFFEERSPARRVE